MRSPRASIPKVRPAARLERRQNAARGSAPPADPRSKPNAQGITSTKYESDRLNPAEPPIGSRYHSWNQDAAAGVQVEAGRERGPIDVERDGPVPRVRHRQPPDGLPETDHAVAERQRRVPVRHDRHRELARWQPVDDEAEVVQRKARRPKRRHHRARADRVRRRRALRPDVRRRAARRERAQEPREIRHARRRQHERSGVALGGPRDLDLVGRRRIQPRIGGRETQWSGRPST